MRHVNPPLPVLSLLALLLLAPAGFPAEGGRYSIVPVPFTRVKVADGFWTPRLETNRKVTVPFDFEKCEETGRIRNFAVAGGLEEGEFEGIYFNDSDVFKVVEGAAYSLALAPDPELDAYLDKLIAKFAAAQEEDGYLYTCRTINPEKLHRSSGKTRWSHLAHSHELYNVGHMYEAAVAHHLATGKRNFLEVAVKSADLVCEVFGPGKKIDVPGHEEIEIGLCRLYLVTGEKKYLDMAKFFLDMRGRKDLRGKLYGAYCQDHLPVIEQTRPVGHAVRAGYLYAGMADVAALTGDRSYIDAIGRIWDNVALKKLYLTGGIGASHAGEAFGEDYELPNATAYNETCAAIANALWNHRLFLLHGDGKYLDVLERILYNGFLSGVALTGDEFFYPNPLSSRGGYQRSPWFGCSCCPTNVVRFLPSIPGYAYAHVRDEDRDEDRVFVNLYLAGSAVVPLKDGDVRLDVDTDYPWDGRVTITVDPGKVESFTLSPRIPGWASDRPVPGDLYHYLDGPGPRFTVRVNDRVQDVKALDGFVSLKRAWKKGDRIELDFPMEPRRVVCHPAVEANRGRVAIERGPVLYCVEGVDHEGYTRHLVLPDDRELRPAFEKDLLGGVMTLRAIGVGVMAGEDGMIRRPQPLTLVPYHVWCHRGAGEMDVWLPRTETDAEPLPRPTLATMSEVSCSHCYGQDTAKAVNDGYEPKDSCDHDIPRLTFWDHRGTDEWVQFDLPCFAALEGGERVLVRRHGQGRLPGARVVAAALSQGRGLRAGDVPGRLRDRAGPFQSPALRAGDHGRAPDRGEAEEGLLRGDPRVEAYRAGRAGPREGRIPQDGGRRGGDPGRESHHAVLV